MKHLADRSWGLSGLLVATASLPTLLALIVVVFMHAAGDTQIHRDLDERATLVAATLAETSEYGLISGNAAALDRSVRELLKRDSAIASIDILDVARRPVVSLAGAARQVGLRSIERPVRSNVPDIDFFDSPTPHVSLSEDVQPTFRPGPVVGYVRVTMSSGPLLSAQRQRLGLQLGIIAAAGAAGIFAFALLARRVVASLSWVLQALGSMLRGNYDVPEGPAVGGELKRVQGCVVELADALAARSHPPRVGNDLAGTEPPLELPSIRMAGLDALRHRDEAQHERIARRIVGRLDAALIAARLSARHATRLADLAASDADKQQAHQTALRILAIADQMNAVGPTLIDPMRSHIVEELGLDAALEELLRACALAHPSCAFRLQKGVSFAGIDASQAVRLHRAVQDALAHVVACSDATEAAVRIETQLDSRDVRVVITDNGQGEASTVSATRLMRMRDSLAASGGRMDIQHSPIAGTTVSFTLPATLTG